MLSQKRALRELYRLSREGPGREDRAWEIRQLRNLDRHAVEYDRAAALGGFTIVESSLEDALISHFADIPEPEKRDLFTLRSDRDAPINSFHVKTLLAYSLGVFGKNTLADMNAIRLIRNVFAHSAGPAFFRRKEIESACQFHVVQSLAGTSFLEPPPVTARENFLAACECLSRYLSGSTDGPLRYRAHTVGHHFS